MEILKCLRRAGKRRRKVEASAALAAGAADALSEELAKPDSGLKPIITLLAERL